MTIEEKAAILSGKTVWQTREIDRLSIPSIFLSDGPHGIRKQAGAGDHLGLNASLNATCFPTAATIANSWNQDLGEEIGQALGEEAASMDVNILLGPGLNIKRSPLCGRNFEYFSEDPYSISNCCPSQISNAVRLNKSMTSFKCSGAQPATYRKASISMVSPDKIAVLSFQTLCTVGFPLRISERSIKSSCSNV